jgi:phenylalanyl-tRNA synthetase beta chain
MKILYSQIKELVPGLSASPKKVGEILTLTGFMMDSFEEIEYNHKRDYLIGLEIRQNRADCLSVIGLAREVAAYYGLGVKYPQLKGVNFEGEKLAIQVNAQDVIKRICAVRMDNVENKESPEWLKQYLSCYEMNSVNLLVDLSNYVMIVTGYPSHIMDKDKISGSICWEVNKNFREVTTLDGTNIKLNRDELIIRDNKSIIALAGIIGSQYGSIDVDSRSIVVEMAVYDRITVRKNSRSLKITTEASSRLEKDLDPNGADYAIGLLIYLIKKYCGGKIVSKMFNHYPDKKINKTVLFNPKMPSIYAGIEISRKDVIKIIKNLRFKITENKEMIKVTPPSDRMDVFLEQDLVEEVIRLYGYNRIPTNIIPALAVVEDITPKHLNMIERIRDILSILGYDEVLTWPLTKKGYNAIVNYKEWEEVFIQNSANEDFSDLRQSIASGLLIQFEEYQKKNLEYINIFEIGKTFGKSGGNYLEYDMLGILLYDGNKTIDKLRITIETLLRELGISEIYYKNAARKPEIANPYSCWDILASKEKLGIIYKIRSYKQVRITEGNVYFAELNITNLAKSINKVFANPTLEITKKIVTLDANVVLRANESIGDYIKDIRKKIGESNIWSLIIKDVYKLSDDKIRYTIRVSYKELSDQKAKEIHLNSFGLR